MVQFIQCGVQGVTQLNEGGTLIEANTDGHILVGCACSIVYTCGLRRQYSIYLRVAQAVQYILAG